MKSTGTNILIYFFLIIVAGQSINLMLKAQENFKRIEGNFKASQSLCEFYKARNGEMAVKVTAMEMTVKEIRQSIPDVIADLKNLYIRPAGLKSYLETTSNTKKEIIVPVRDSIQTPTAGHPDPAPIKTIKFTDKWFNVHGYLQNDTARLTIVTSDTIKSIIHKSRIHPALWIFSRYTFKAVVTNVNPSNTLSIAK